MAEKFNDTEYLYLTSVVRARQANMLSSEIFEQMLSAGSFKLATNILTDYGWADMSDMDSSAINSYLSNYQNSIFREIEEYVPQIEVLDLFRIKYDYHNAKCIIKSEGYGTKLDPIYSEVGRVTFEELEKAYRNEDYRFIPLPFAKSIIEARSVLAKTSNPQFADFVLDKSLYKELLTVANYLDNEFLIQYVMLQIDGANLRTLVRCSRMKKDVSFVQNALIPGGSVTPECLLRAFPSGEALGLFATSKYKEAVSLGNDALNGGRLTEFELECDNTINRFVRDAKLRGFGPEAIVGYLSAVEGNVTSLRMILTGLLADISPETIRERLRLSYV